MKRTLRRLVAGKDLTAEQMQDVIIDMMSGKYTNAQIGAFLVALQIKGITLGELVGGALAMRSKMTKVQCDHWPIVDTCGTGGDRSGTFNISTTAAFVIAGAGICVAKHGNRAVSSRSGSSDVLDALEVNIKLGPNGVERCLQEAGIGFLYAPKLHKAMKYAAKPRKELGMKTIFNLLGPLTNPAGATIQLVGVFDCSVQRLYAEALRELGCTRAMVVCGSDGLDEITLTGSTDVVELADGEIRNWTIEPEVYGFERVDPEQLKGGSPEENARLLENILNGQEVGPKRDIVVLNAGAVIYLAGDVDTVDEGIAKAAESIDSGQAASKLEALRWLAPKAMEGVR